jgi:hypothetical protein
MMDRVMSLNGYSWVEGNVVNAVDPSGMISGFGVVHMLNSACYMQQTPSACTLNNRIDVIASFGRQESNQEDDQLLPTAAAIAIAEINYLGFGNNTPRSRASTYSERTEYIDAETSRKIWDFVAGAVQGACNGTLVASVNRLSSSINELASYASDLEFIAQNPTMAYEHSFVSDNRPEGASSADSSGVRRGERLSSRTITNVDRQEELFKFRVFRGTTRSVIISNDFNPVPLEWNCTVASNRVINSSFNPNLSTTPDFVGNSSCIASCQRNLWWWRAPTPEVARRFATEIYGGINPQYTDGNLWIKLPNDDGTSNDFQAVIVSIGGTGHVASCT